LFTILGPGIHTIIATISTSSEPDLNDTNNFASVTIFATTQGHDLDIIGSSISRTQTYVGVSMINPVSWNVTVANRGLTAESFWVAALANSTILLGNQTVTVLPSATRVVQFTWFPPAS